MSLQRGRLADIQYIAATAGSIYANPAASKSYIRSIILHNTNTVPETVELYNVPDNSTALGTAADGNKFFEKDLSPNETFIFSFEEYPIVLEDQNDSIQAVTTNASKVTVMINGDIDN